MLLSACRLVTATILVLVGLSWPAPVAEAEPLPADFSGSTDNEILGLDVGLLGFNLAGVGLGHTDTSVDSAGSPPSAASAANLAAAVAGIPVAVSSVGETAPPDDGGPTSTGLTEVDVPGLLDTGVITGTVDAHWAGDLACPPSGTAINSSTVEVAGVTLGNAVTEILDVGAVTTSGSTALTSNGGSGDARSVVSSSTGTIAALTLLNGNVTVDVGGSPTLTATASGEPGGADVTYSAPSVRVQGPGGLDVVLQVGVPVTVSIPVVGSVTLNLGVPTVTESPDSRTAVGDVSLLSIDVSLALGAETASIDVLPLHAEAHAPEGGVQCGLLDAPAITSPADGSSTTDTTPTISGTGLAGATVTVSEGATVIGTATVQPDGTWTLVPATPLAAGPHTITATQSSGDATSAPSPEVTFTVVDETPPDPPAIETPADGSVTSDATPTITGTGEPGAEVEVSIDGTVIGTTTVGPGGGWSLDATTPLADGPHTVAATQTDPSGNTSDPTTSGFTVDTTAPAPPAITGPADGSVVGDATPTITGTGEAGAEVEVSVDGTVIGTTTVDPGGSWTIDATTPLADGPHAVEATQTDPAGNTSGPATSGFEVDTTADAPVIESPTSGTVTNDPTTTISGTAEPGATVTVDVDGTTYTTSADGDGSWSVTTDPLADGSHTAVATQVDGAGNTSPASSPVVFTVDTEVEPPVILTPADGEVTADDTPTVTGTAEPGSEVVVTIGDVELTTTADPVTGAWEVTVPDGQALPDGEHTVSAVATDPASNTSEPATSQLIVDTTAPDAPVISTPADGSTTADPTPSVTGTAEPGAAVEVRIDGTLVGSTVADGTGAWSITPATPLADGPHTVAATQTDPAGNTSDAASNAFTVDTAAAPPAIDPTLDGLLTDDDTPTISGTGEPGATVTVTTDSGQELGSAVVGADGTWSFDAAPMADGPHTLTAVQVDAVGNTSAASAPVTITIDTVVEPPVVDPPTEPVTTDTTPTVTGTAEPGATVTVSVDGEVVGTATANGDGEWSFTLPPQPDGAHEVTATQTDPAGNASGPSEPVTITVDTTAPAAPTITAPADGSVTNDPQPPVTGTAEPGATVEVVLDGTTYTVEAGGDGTWEVTPASPLADGSYTVSVTATDEAGNTSPPATSTFEVDTTAPGAPDITGPADGSTVGTSTPTITGTAEPGSTVTVVVDGTSYETTADASTGAWSVEVTEPLADGPVEVTATATDAAGNTGPAASSSFVVDTTAAAPVITSPSSGTVTNDQTVPLTGTGEPGATVTVRDENGDPVATAVVDGTGSWSAETTALPEGVHTLTATQTDEAGNTSPASAPVQVTVDLTAEPPVVDDLPDGGLTNDSTPEITGTGEPGATVTVEVDGTPAGTTTVDEDGTWTFTPTEPLTEGPHEVTATQTDEAGNTSGPSEPVEVVVDTTAPAAPVITSPGDGEEVDDRTPTITGTGEPGATVEVTVDGVVVGTTEVGGDGTWSLDVASPLPDGPHTVEVTQTDAAGNTSEPGTSDFVVETPAPAAPTVDAPGTTDDRTPTITGTGEPGSTVDILLDGAVVGSAEVDDDGTWTFTFDEPLSCGTHEVGAVQRVDTARKTLRSAPAPVQEITILCDTGGGNGGGGAGGLSGLLPDTGAAAGLTGSLLLGSLMLATGVLLLRRRES
ncbi:Ig-like domain-containing protein [Nocardioides sp. J54]|uniref:Ig-like domain-containing protein n=1 Tax=Nocardioides sp. J54 TaxID=935866 RepID=UPI0004B8CFE6|nr:Ig-like domain-containing protein [Nocardioides sp. J54]